MNSERSLENARILLADDEPDLLDIMRLAVGNLGAEVHAVSDGQQVLDLLKTEQFDLLVCDQFMPHATGLQILQASRNLQPPPVFILITGEGTIDLAVQAMRNGAQHFIEKPFNIKEFVDRVCGALENVELARENRNLRQAVESRYFFGGIIGTSKALERALEHAQRAAEQSSPVLVLGESGSGKDLVARAIHFHSPRRLKPFIPINCGAIPENLIESEFFGHKKGSFTGAIVNRKGCFEEVAGGTLFLDEIGEMPLDMQVKLLRVLEEHKIRRIGENIEIPVDFRIIAATNRPLSELVDRKVFRQDLYYRLNVLTIHLPPLRDRLDDVVPLAEHYLRKSRAESETRVTTITPAAMEALQHYHYPGNVRELFNILQRALLLCDAEKLEPRHLPLDVLGADAAAFMDDDEDDLNLKKATQKAQESVERRLIHRALTLSEGNHKKAAEMLGISRGALYNKLAKLETEPETAS